MFLKNLLNVLYFLIKLFLTIFEYTLNLLFNKPIIGIIVLLYLTTFVIKVKKN